MMEPTVDSFWSFQQNEHTTLTFIIKIKEFFLQFWNLEEFLYFLNVLFFHSDDLQPWLRWAYWISPFSYSLNAIALNEFLDNRWSTVSQT